MDIIESSCLVCDTLLDDPSKLYCSSQCHAADAQPMRSSAPSTSRQPTSHKMLYTIGRTSMPRRSSDAAHRISLRNQPSFPSASLMSKPLSIADAQASDMSLIPESDGHAIRSGPIPSPSVPSRVFANSRHFRPPPSMPRAKTSPFTLADATASMATAPSRWSGTDTTGILSWAHQVNSSIDLSSEDTTSLLPIASVPVTCSESTFARARTHRAPLLLRTNTHCQPIPPALSYDGSTLSLGLSSQHTSYRPRSRPTEHTSIFDDFASTIADEETSSDDPYAEYTTNDDDDDEDELENDAASTTPTSAPTSASKRSQQPDASRTSAERSDLARQVRQWTRPAPPLVRSQTVLPATRRPSSPLGQLEQQQYVDDADEDEDEDEHVSMHIRATAAAKQSPGLRGRTPRRESAFAALRPVGGTFSDEDE